MNYGGFSVRLEAGGKVISAGAGRGDFRIFELDGLTGLDFDFTTSSGPHTPSTVILNKKPLPREITLGIRTEGENRDFLSGFFNPFEKGRLTVEWSGRIRFINYFPYPVKMEQTSAFGGTSAFVKLICPEPYWLSVDDYGKNIASRQKLLAFPFAFKDFIVPDYKIFSTEVLVVNGGDVPAPLKLIFRAAGNVKNPCITLNEKEFLRVITDMEKGDVIEFSTDTDDLYVTMNGEDILNRTDPKMSFFQLAAGDNILVYSADDGTYNLNVYVYYRARYMGV